MNYIVLNGKKSTSIQGLLISSLPPISKPLIRTQIEEIDGRDGDIVTKLGYSAYDKVVEIGLYGDFNVDDVIAYFDSAGTVIFSNEPNKYYNYEIIDQIDFERLIRFKTATVTFHVQPFKYSAVEKELIYSIKKAFSFSDNTLTKNGITLNAQDGKIVISGTGSAATEFYLPIQSLSLNAGNYTLRARATGTKASACSIRLINDIPNDENSFGGTYLALKNDDTATLSAHLTAKKTYNYLWFYITAGNAMYFDLSVAVIDNGLDSVPVTNTGNTISKPKITIIGSGTINLSLNGLQIFVIDLGNEEYITIDAAQMEAYKDDVLKNRLVTGDYDNLAFRVGKNTLSWTGNVELIEIENYSRWI